MNKMYSCYLVMVRYNRTTLRYIGMHIRNKCQITLLFIILDFCLLISHNCFELNFIFESELFYIPLINISH